MLRVEDTVLWRPWIQHSPLPRTINLSHNSTVSPPRRRVVAKLEGEISQSCPKLGTFCPKTSTQLRLLLALRVSLSKIEISAPRYFLDLPSQHVSERVVFGPFAVTRGRKLLETFLDLQIFSVPERRKNWHAGLGVARNTTTPVSLDT